MSYNVSRYTVYDGEKAHAAITAISEYYFEKCVTETDNKFFSDIWTNSITGHAGIRSLRIRMYPEFVSPYSSHAEEWAPSEEELVRERKAARREQYEKCAALRDMLIQKILQILEEHGVTNCAVFLARQPFTNLSVIILYKSGTVKAKRRVLHIGDVVDAFPTDEGKTHTCPVIRGKIVKFVVSRMYVRRYYTIDDPDELYTELEARRHVIVECLEPAFGYKQGELVEADYAFKAK